MKQIMMISCSTVILLSVLFVRCSNNISDRDIESNKQKSVKEYGMEISKLCRCGKQHEENS